MAFMCIPQGIYEYVSDKGYNLLIMQTLIDHRGSSWIPKYDSPECLAFTCLNNMGLFSPPNDWYIKLYVYISSLFAQLF